MSNTLIILNPNAAGGRAKRVWKKLEPILIDRLGELVVAITHHPEEVANHIEQAYQAGLTRVISVGGDGTNHSLINALAEHNRQYPELPQMIYGILPVGTGHDWARMLRIPTEVDKAAEWIISAQPKSIDLGMLRYDDNRQHFLNIASAGIGGDIATRVNNVRQRRAWTFLNKTVQTLVRYTPRHLNVVLDGEEWYDGTSYALAVANGTTFGRGMQVAPHAKIDDGEFDVVLVEGVSKRRIFPALPTLYRGTHLDLPIVRWTRAKSVQVTSSEGVIPIELDGEVAQGNQLHFELQPSALKMLI